MIVDTTEELFAMADAIGVSRRWFQNAKYPHFDICKTKRKKAVALGAIEIDRKTFVDVVHRISRTRK